MNDRRCKARTVLPVALAAATMLTGCATFRGSEARSTEELLTAAGFVMRPAVAAPLTDPASDRRSGRDWRSRDRPTRPHSARGRDPFGSLVGGTLDRSSARRTRTGDLAAVPVAFLRKKMAASRRAPSTGTHNGRRH